MTFTTKISCVIKNSSQNAWDCITHIGGTSLNGERWNLPIGLLIKGIEEKDFSFYIEGNSGDRIKIIVAMSATGNKYLKTELDGDWPNKLLRLPECF